MRTKLFDFDLQLFGEGEAPVADSGSGDMGGTEAPSTPEPTSEPAGADTQSDSVEHNSDSNVFLKVNPNTGERTLEFGTTEEVQDPATSENTEADQPEGEPSPVVSEATTQPEMYSDSEFLQAYSAGKIDYSRVTQEQQEHINVAQQNALAYQQAVAQRQAMEQQMAQQQAVARKQALGRIAGEAKALAMKQCGLTPEDLQNLEYLENGEERLKQFNNLYSSNFEGLYARMIEQEVQAKQVYNVNEACRNEIAGFCNQESINEPHYNEILQLMNTARSSMPYDKAVKIIQTEQNLNNNSCTPADLQVIREYYDECKKMVYQKYGNVSKVPQRTTVPKVESSGTPNVQTAPPPDFSKLRGLSQHDRDAAVMSFISGRNND